MPLARHRVFPNQLKANQLSNCIEVQKEQVFPKIFIGKAEPMGKVELYEVIESLLDMGPVELKETLVGVANTKFSEKIDSLVSNM